MMDQVTSCCSNGCRDSWLSSSAKEYAILSVKYLGNTTHVTAPPKTGMEKTWVSIPAQQQTILETFTKLPEISVKARREFNRPFYWHRFAGEFSGEPQGIQKDTVRHRDIL